MHRTDRGTIFIVAGVLIATAILILVLSCASEKREAACQAKGGVLVGTSGACLKKEVVIRP